MTRSELEAHFDSATRCAVCGSPKIKKEFKQWGNYCSKTCTNKGEAWKIQKRENS